MIRRATVSVLAAVFVLFLSTSCDREEVAEAEKEARRIAEVAKREGKEFLTAAQKHARVICQKIEEALRASAIDPKQDPSDEERALDLAVKLVPFVGPVKRYANARVLYEHAIETSDADAAREAKRQCLLAAAEEGLDVATLGSSAFTRVADAADLTVAVVRLSSTASALTGVEELDAFRPLADQALEARVIDRAVVMLLTVPIADLSLLRVPIGELVPEVEESASD